MSFASIRIGRRLTLAQAFVMAAIAALSFIAIAEVEAIADKLRIVNDVNGVKQRYAINFRGSVHDRAIALRDVALARDAAEIESAVDDIMRLRAFYDDSAGPLDALMGDADAEETRILASIKAIEAQTKPLTDRVVALRRMGDVAGAQRLLLDEARPAFTTWLARINEFIDLQEAKNNALGAATRASADSFQLRNALLTATAMVIALGVGLAVARSVTAPLSRLQRAMERLAAGETDIDVDGVHRRDEIGDMSRAVEVFRENAVARARLEADQRAETEARLAREATLRALVERFRGGVGDVMASIDEAARQMGETAESLSGLAETTRGRTNSAATSSTQASTNVQTVASAAEELSASISEISAQLSRATDIVSRVTQRATRTSDEVTELAGAARRIGEVVDMIQEIAEQTNLLALNATIEAARAGARAAAASPWWRARSRRWRTRRPRRPRRSASRSPASRRRPKRPSRRSPRSAAP
jgi:methyl-accepting chemotaxis protein